MALVTLAEAARLTGKNASTITRAVQKGKVSCEIDGNGQRVFDPAELERAFGKLRNIEENINDASVPSGANALEGIMMHDEIKRLYEREIALVREQANLMQNQIEDLRKDRDHWRQQATYLIEDKRKIEIEEIKKTSESEGEDVQKKKKKWWIF